MALFLNQDIKGKKLSRISISSKRRELDKKACSTEEKMRLTGTDKRYCHFPDIHPTVPDSIFLCNVIVFSQNLDVCV